MELRGEKVLIRPLAEEEAPAALAFLLENRAFLEQWEPVRNESWFTLEAQRFDIETALVDGNADRRYAFGIFSGDELVGRIALNQISRGMFQNAYLGYSIGERWNGRGLATETVGLAVRFAFEEAGLHRVQAAVMPRNAASIRVLEKNGFREEGYAVDYLKINGAWEDHRIYARTTDQRRTWRNAAEPPGRAARPEAASSVARYAS